LYPNIRWNSLGAVLGTVTSAWLDDDLSLTFETFLVAPLLDMSNMLLGQHHQISRNGHRAGSTRIQGRVR